MERAGPIRRWIKEVERGYFEFEDKDHNDDVESVENQSLLSRIFGAGKQSSDALKNCKHCPKMVVVKAGFFQMGAASNDGDAKPEETPTKLIGIDRPFAIGRYEVTVGQYGAFVEAAGRPRPQCSSTPAVSDSSLPVSCVSWRDAQEYVEWLSKTTGLNWYLPSEAEWEFAARGGVTTRYVTGHELSDKEKLANFSGHVLPIVGRKPNEYGLHDVHGNLAEIVGGCWVQSPTALHGNGTSQSSASGCRTRVLRDAHAGEAITLSRLSARRPIDPDAKSPGVGFRVARAAQ